MHNALVDFRTQTTYETATDSVVHASHLDAAATAADTAKKHAHALGQRRRTVRDRSIGADGRRAPHERAARRENNVGVAAVGTTRRRRWWWWLRRRRRWWRYALRSDGGGDDDWCLALVGAGPFTEFEAKRYAVIQKTSTDKKSGSSSRRIIIIIIITISLRNTSLIVTPPKRRPVSVVQQLLRGDRRLEEREGHDSRKYLNGFRVLAVGHTAGQPLNGVTLKPCKDFEADYDSFRDTTFRGLSPGRFVSLFDRPVGGLRLNIFFTTYKINDTSRQYNKVQTVTVQISYDSRRK